MPNPEDENEDVAGLLDEQPEPVMDIAENVTETKPSNEAAAQPGNQNSGIDVAALGAALGASLKPTIEGLKPPTAPKVWTEEELDKEFHRWKPTKEWIAKFDNLETREAAIAEMHQGQVKHMDAVTQLRVNLLEAKIQEMIAPLVHAQIQQQEEAAYKTFNKAYPQLSAPELRPFINQIAGQLQAEGFKEKGDKFLDAVATRLAGALKATNPTFTLTPRGSASGSSSGGKSKSNPNAVKSNSFGGGGGNSSAGNVIESGSTKAIASLFDGK